MTRTAITANGIYVTWRHLGSGMCEWTLSAGTWCWESEPARTVDWPFEKVKGLAAGLDHLATLGPSEAAAIIDTIRRGTALSNTMPQTPDNVVPFKSRSETV